MWTRAGFEIFGSSVVGLSLLTKARGRGIRVEVSDFDGKNVFIYGVNSRKQCFTTK